MRFNVVGSDPETGDSVELVVEAASVEEAASAAQRRDVHVISVSMAEMEQAEGPSVPSETSATAQSSAGAHRPGKELRTLAALALVASFLPSGSRVAAAGPISADSQNRALTVLNPVQDPGSRGYVRNWLRSGYCCRRGSRYP